MKHILDKETSAAPGVTSTFLLQWLLLIPTTAISVMNIYYQRLEFGMILGVKLWTLGHHSAPCASSY
jgi:hypothetical protein